MAHYNPNPPFGGPPFQYHPQYLPLPPPPNIAYSFGPPPPNTQAPPLYPNHRPPSYGHPGLQSSYPPQYANTAAFQGNAQYPPFPSAPNGKISHHLPTFHGFMQYPSNVPAPQLPVPPQIASQSFENTQSSTKHNSTISSWQTPASLPLKPSSQPLADLEQAKVPDRYPGQEGRADGPGVRVTTGWPHNPASVYTAGITLPKPADSRPPEGYNPLVTKHTPSSGEPSLKTVPNIPTKSTPPATTSKPDQLDDMNGLEIPSEIPAGFLGQRSPSGQSVTVSIDSGEIPMSQQSLSSSIPETISQHYVMNIRTQAKAALQSLNSRDIGFKKILAEGVDELVLKTLYHEIGLSLPELIERKTSSEEDVHAVSQASLTSSLAKPALNHTVPQQLVQPSVAEPSLVPLVVQSETRKADESGEQSGRNFPKKPSPKAAASKPLDRKVYIAKLLAAKSGKSTIPSKNTEPSVAPVTAVASSKNDSESTEVTRPSSAIVSSPQSCTPLELSGPENMKKPEAKSLSQTERVRQKLEALKKSTQLKQPSTQISVETPNTPQSQDDILSSPLHTASAQKPLADRPKQPSPSPHYTPVNSFFACEDRESFGGIPGLSVANATLSVPELSTTSATLLRMEINVEDEGSVVREQDEQRPQPYPDFVSEQASVLEDTLTSSGEGEDNMKDHDTFVPPLRAIVGSRKRPTAVDFIDSPGDRVKRRPTSNDRISLVIELSDEEGEEEEEEKEDVVEDGRMAIDEFISENTTTARSLSNTTDSWAKGIRHVPPSASFPSQAVSQVVSGSGTPSARPVSKGLAEHEEQIRKLQQKIAEMEQRRRVKRGHSGAVTPQQSSQPMLDAALSNTSEQNPVASDLVTTAKQLVEQQSALESANHQLQAQQASLAAVKNVLRERLDSEKRTQALLTAKVELERQTGLRATSPAERQKRQERRKRCEATISRLDSEVEEAKARLEQLRLQSEEIQAEIQRGIAGRNALRQEYEELLRASQVEDIEQKLPASPQKQECQDDAAADPGEMSTTIAVGEAIHDHSYAPDQPHTLITRESSIESVDARPQIDTFEETMDISSSSADEGEVAEQPRVVSSLNYPDAVHGSEQESDYEPCDIQTSTQEVNGEQEHDEYEPVLEVDNNHKDYQRAESGLQSPMDQSQESYESGLDVAEPICRSPDLSPSIMFDEDGGDSFAPDPALLTPENEGNIVSQEEGEILDVDNDDYEPPEAMVSVDNTADSDEPPGAISSRSTSFQVGEIIEDRGYAQHESMAVASDAAPTGSVAQTNDDEQEYLSTRNERVDSHFAPYESPLRFFKSYRYHPEYVKEVPGGFRSLSYSHKINPNQELCRWELQGGICNDAACIFQHFRDINLSGDQILLQLGSTQEGRTQDELNDYINGMRQLLTSMRDRNIADVQVLASEIVAYRSRFLRDNSRILTRLDPDVETH